MTSLSSSSSSSSPLSLPSTPSEPVVPLKPVKLPPLVRNDTEATVPTGRRFVLYFSAFYCGPSRSTTYTLREEYEDAAKSADSPEIIFVSCDRTSEEFAEYSKEMPWLVVPFENEDAREALKERFNVNNNIPRIVACDALGYVNNYSSSERTWKAIMPMVENFTMFNMCRNMHTNMAPTVALLSAADDVIFKQFNKAAAAHPELLFINASCNAGAARQLYHVLNPDIIETTPMLVMCGSDFFVPPAVSGEMDVATFIESYDVLGEKLVYDSENLRLGRP